MCVRVGARARFGRARGCCCGVCAHEAVSVVPATLTWRKLHKIDQVQAIYVSCGSQGSVVILAIKELRAMSLKTPDKV